MLQLPVREIMNAQGVNTGGHLSVANRLANAGGCVLVDSHHTRKRQLTGPAIELEPVIKQERLDTGYDQAVSCQSGTVLGTVIQNNCAGTPHPITVSSYAEPYRLNLHQTSTQRSQLQKQIDSRSKKAAKTDSTSGRGKKLHNRPVFLAPRGTTVSSNFPPVPAILSRVPITVPRVQISSTPRLPVYISGHQVVNTPNVVRVSRGVTPGSTRPEASMAPVVVVVSQPLVGGTTVHSGATPTIPSSSGFRQPVIRLPIASRLNDDVAATRSFPISRLQTILGKNVLGKYSGPHEPPPELQMPVRTKRVCLSCGDQFVTEVGLVDHMSRRSMMISFRCVCNVSRWPRLFYNPCMFDNFYRSHRLRPGTHLSQNAALVSVLDASQHSESVDDQLNKQKEKATAGTEARPNLETTNSQQTTEDLPSDVSPVSSVSANETRHCSENPNTQTTSDVSNSNSCTVSTTAGATVKEIYVNLEVVPAGSKRPSPDVNKSKDPTAVAVTETNKSVGKAVSASQAKKGRHQSKVPVNGTLSTKVAEFFDALSHNKGTCPECLVVFQTRKVLGEHFSSCFSTGSLCCNVCRLLLPNTCSLRAHERMHKNQQPFVCPNCGLLFDTVESVEVFKAHVERQCLHSLNTPSNSFTTTCPKCSFKLPEPDVVKLAEHFVDAHAAVYHKCASCPKAFGNAAAAERHTENTGHNARRRIVRKCPSCDSVFREDTEDNIQLHVVEHLNTPQLQCPVCSMCVSQQSAALEHIQSSHPDYILPTTTCEVCGRPESSQEALFIHISTQHPDYFESIIKCLPSATNSTSAGSAEDDSQLPDASVSGTSKSLKSTAIDSEDSTSSPMVTECAQCHMEFQSEELYKRHVAKHLYLKAKIASKKQAAPKSTAANPFQQVPLSTDLACTRCGQKYDSSESLEHHISKVHGSPRWHLCHLCASAFSTGEQLERHVDTQHCGKDRSSEGFVCSLCAQSPDIDRPVVFSVRGILTRHLQTAHRVPKTAATIMAKAATPAAQKSEPNSPKEVPESAQPTAADIEPVKQLFVSGQTTCYQCSRCEFSTEDRALFVVHAGEHKPAVSGAVQCMECAASFAVAPALYRHLRIVHRISCDINTYLRDNGNTSRCSSPNSINSDNEISPVDVETSHTRWLGDSNTPKSTGKHAASERGNSDDAPAECNVCYRVFLTKDLLRAHMRVHGMAFIQGTRRRLSAANSVSSGPSPP